MAISNQRQLLTARSSRQTCYRERTAIYETRSLVRPIPHLFILTILIEPNLLNNKVEFRSALRKLTKIPDYIIALNVTYEAIAAALATNRAFIRVYLIS